MKRVFGDASYFVAFLSARDHWHARAIALNQQPTGPLVTTEWVLTEVGDAFSLPSSRPKFLRLLQILRQQPDAEVVPASTDLFEALSNDHHFEQAGFRILLKG